MPGETEAVLVYAHRAKTAHAKCWLRVRASRAGQAIILSVARGWESKSVELQQDDARSAGEPKRPLTPEQREIESRREGLKLSRSRILEQLHSTQNPLYRKTLEQALAALDEQIVRLG